MLNVYGPVHGFGWKINDVVGAQIISVPMSVPIRIADRAYKDLLFFLIATLVVTMAALDLGVYWFVIRAAARGLEHGRPREPGREGRDPGGRDRA